MPWIREEDVGLTNIFKAMSINPRAMAAVYNLVRAISFGASALNSALTRVQEEAIATAVSAANKCRYSTLAHGRFLRHHSDNPELAGHVMHDYNQAELDPQTRAMLDFAVKLTREPWAMAEGDVQELRTLGISDEQVLGVVLITSLFNFTNRLADGLGVEVPSGRQEAVEQWLTGPAAQQEWLLRPKAGSRV